MTNPPSATMHTDFQFHWSYAKIGLQNWCKKMRGFLTLLKSLSIFSLSIFGGHVTNPPAIPHTDFQFYYSEAKIGLPIRC